MMQAEDGGAVAAPRGRGQWVRWTAAMTGAFLDELAATGNIAAAARGIGVNVWQAYYRHRTDAAFAADWRAALDAGLQTVEARLIAHVLSGGTPAAGEAADGFDYDRALVLVKLGDARRAGRGRRTGPKEAVATREDSDAAILRRLATLAAAKARRGTEGV